MQYDDYENEFFDTSLDAFKTYEEYLDSHITKEDLMYLKDIELARQLKEEVSRPPLRATTPRPRSSAATSSWPRRRRSRTPARTRARTRPSPWRPPSPT